MPHTFKSPACSVRLPPRTCFGWTDFWSRICIDTCPCCSWHDQPWLPASWVHHVTPSVLPGLISAILLWPLDSPSACIYSLILPLICLDILCRTPRTCATPSPCTPHSPTSCYGGLWLHHSGPKVHKFPCTGGNFYMPVSPDLSYHARLVQGVRKGCYMAAPGEK